MLSVHPLATATHFNVSLLLTTIGAEYSVPLDAPPLPLPVGVVPSVVQTIAKDWAWLTVTDVGELIRLAPGEKVGALPFSVKSATAAELSAVPLLDAMAWTVSVALTVMDAPLVSVVPCVQVPAPLAVGVLLSVV